MIEKPNPSWDSGESRKSPLSASLAMLQAKRAMHAAAASRANSSDDVTSPKDRASPKGMKTSPRQLQVNRAQPLAEAMAEAMSSNGPKSEPHPIEAKLAAQKSATASSSASVTKSDLGKSATASSASVTKSDQSKSEDQSISDKPFDKPPTAEMLKFNSSVFDESLSMEKTISPKFASSPSRHSSPHLGVPGGHSYESFQNILSCDSVMPSAIQSKRTSKNTLPNSEEEEEPTFVRRRALTHSPDPNLLQFLATGGHKDSYMHSALNASQVGARLDRLNSRASGSSSIPPCDPSCSSPNSFEPTGRDCLLPGTLERRSLSSSCGHDEVYVTSPGSSKFDGEANLANFNRDRAHLDRAHTAPPTDDSFHLSGLDGLEEPTLSVHNKNEHDRLSKQKYRSNRTHDETTTDEQPGSSSAAAASSKNQVKEAGVRINIVTIHEDGDGDGDDSDSEKSGSEGEEDKSARPRQGRRMSVVSITSVSQLSCSQISGSEFFDIWGSGPGPVPKGVVGEVQAKTPGRFRPWYRRFVTLESGVLRYYKQTPGSYDVKTIAGMRPRRIFNLHANIKADLIFNDCQGTCKLVFHAGRGNSPARVLKFRPVPNGSPQVGADGKTRPCPSYQQWKAALVDHQRFALAFHSTDKDRNDDPGSDKNASSSSAPPAPAAPALHRAATAPPGNQKDAESASSAAAAAGIPAKIPTATSKNLVVTRDYDSKEHEERVSSLAGIDSCEKRKSGSPRTDKAGDTEQTVMTRVPQQSTKTDQIRRHTSGSTVFDTEEDVVQAKPPVGPHPLEGTLQCRIVNTSKGQRSLGQFFTGWHHRRVSLVRGKLFIEGMQSSVELFVPHPPEDPHRGSIIREQSGLCPRPPVVNVCFDSTKGLLRVLRPGQQIDMRAPKSGGSSWKCWDTNTANDNSSLLPRGTGVTPTTPLTMQRWKIGMKEHVDFAKTQHVRPTNHTVATTVPGESGECSV